MNTCILRVERRGDEFLIMIPPEIVEEWGLQEGSVVEVRPVASDEESLDSRIAFLDGLIGLWREEEERLCAMVADSGTSQEVRRQANERLARLREIIQDHKEELAQLQGEQ